MLQARRRLSRALFPIFQQCVGRALKVHKTTTLLLVTVPHIHRFFSLTDSATNFFLIWLLTTPSHLKYAATLRCNLSLMVCFADINVSQGSVATYTRCGGIFNIHLTANLPRNLPVKEINRFRFGRIVATSLWPRFFGAPRVDAQVCKKLCVM